MSLFLHSVTSPSLTGIAQHGITRNLYITATLHHALMPLFSNLRVLRLFGTAARAYQNHFT